MPPRHLEPLKIGESGRFGRGVDSKSQQEAGDDNDNFDKQAHGGNQSAIGPAHTPVIQSRGRRSPALT